jgi:hypothetical protein
MIVAAALFAVLVLVATAAVVVASRVISNAIDRAFERIE